MSQDLKGQFQKDMEQEKKRAAGEPAQLAKEKARREADSAREQKIQREHLENEAKRARKHAAEEPRRLAKEKERREADLAKEQTIAKEQDARRRKT